MILFLVMVQSILFGSLVGFFEAFIAFRTWKQYQIVGYPCDFVNSLHKAPLSRENLLWAEHSGKQGATDIRALKQHRMFRQEIPDKANPKLQMRGKSLDHPFST